MAKSKCNVARATRRTTEQQQENTPAALVPLPAEYRNWCDSVRGSAQRLFGQITRYRLTSGDSVAFTNDNVNGFITIQVETERLALFTAIHDEWDRLVRNHDLSDVDPDNPDLSALLIFRSALVPAVETLRDTFKRDGELRLAVVPVEVWERLRLAVGRELEDSRQLAAPPFPPDGSAFVAAKTLREQRGMMTRCKTSSRTRKRKRPK